MCIRRVERKENGGTDESMNSPINRDPKRPEQCGKNFLTKLAPKVISNKFISSLLAPMNQ